MVNSDSIKSEIIAKLSDKIIDKPLLKQFVQSFYAYIPLDFSNKYKTDDLVEIATNSFEYFLQRTPNKHQILIKNYPESESTVIKIINDDMPFLVDSITEFLTKKNFHIKQLINALLTVERDSNGNLSSIIENNHHTPNESFLYIKLDLIKDTAQLNKLSLELSYILNEVKTVVTDWQAMVEAVNHTMQWFGKCEDDNCQFLKWLTQGNFTFTGSQRYKITKGKIEETTSKLGIFKLNNSDLENDIIEDVFTPNNYLEDSKTIMIGKIKTLSNVHKNTNLDYIAVVNHTDAKNTIVDIFVGMFASKLDYQSFAMIPIIQTKALSVLNRAGFGKVSFLGKELFSIIETFPREELLQISSEELYQTTMSVLSCLNNPRLLAFARSTDCKNFLNLMIFFPKSRVTSDIVDKVCNVIKESIPGKFINNSLKISSMALAYVYITLKVKDNTKLKLDLGAIEKKLDLATSLWNEKLDLYIEEKFGKQSLSAMLAMYKKSFPTNYQNKFTLSDAVNDIAYMEKISNDNPIIFNLYQQDKQSNNIINLKIYSLGKKIELFKMMPIIDNLGFKSIEENTYILNVAKFEAPVNIQDFSLSIDTESNLVLKDSKDNIENAIGVIYNEKLKNDAINNLILTASLSWREVFLLSAYSKYIIQMKFPYSQDYIRFVLTKHWKLAKLFVELFYAMFNPKKHSKTTIEQIQEKIKQNMNGILDNAEDRVLRTILDVVTHTIRTNYFQKDKNNQLKDYVSIKLNSAELADLPKPKPMVEIFVYSTKMEGIHLRGGKVARGGIRWSDRSEDYRTEILGLMKAQMTKNAIIVPVGSKGGFFVKQSSRFASREEYLAEGIECYKTLLRGMLDITDNIIEGKIVHPQEVVCLDEEDPYLVVAADKGTATFSDIANQISKEYNFWLGDAFASGGSAGYDHKKMGITARGAWISALEHFKALGRNPNKDVFTAVGIGDMSGDVFGNGMLLSDKMQLVAAFNHIHIFIDPNPDPAKSFAERKRMFELPRSNWTDYNSNLISEGGGVFERSAKSIKLSPQAKALLDIQEDNIDPDSLIRKILMAKVDLLWNGGIGTYFKAETESNEEIGNKGNDSVRINGKDLRCKVVAEGGNLGFTQLSRIEYEFNGGKINTDALDNSAGVDCSDHEVNIKIALTAATESGKLSLTDRNDLLASMTEEVGQLVLYDNIIQNQSISISSSHSVKMFESYVRLMRTLEADGLLDRKVEFLPSEEEIVARSKNALGFTRPELAVLMAYSKNVIFKNLIKSKLPEDPYFEKYLISYFPSQMQKKYLPEILGHRLRREIISTIIANKLVNHLGSYFFHVAQEYTGLNGCDIARAFCIVWEIFDLEMMWKEVEALDSLIKTELFSMIQNFAQSSIYWFLRNKAQLLHIEKIIQEFKIDTSILIKTISEQINGDVKKRFDDKYKYCCSNNIPTDLATRVAGLNVLYSAMDITAVTTKTDAKLSDVSLIYFTIGQRFNLDWLKYAADQLPADTYWQRMLIYTIKDDVYDHQRRLTAQIVKYIEKHPDAGISEWTQDNSKKVAIFDQFIAGVKAMQDLDSNKLVVATKQIERLTQ